MTRAVVVFIVICFVSALVAQRTQTWVISDIHLGSTWFTDPVKIQGLRNFLGNLTLPTAPCHTLVIAGDIIEMWQNPFDENQVPAQTILSSATQLGSPVKEFIDTLKLIRKNNITIVVMPGNHDQELTHDDLTRVGLDVVWRDEAYIVNNLRIEHGHLYDLYNAPDPAGIRPFGYFVSRAVSTSKRAGSIGSIGVFICQLILSQSAVVSAIRYNALPLLQKVMDNALGGSIASSAYTMFNRYKYATVRQGCFYSDIADDVLLGLAVYKYRGLYDRWITSTSADYVQNMVKGGCNEFDYFLSRMPQDLVIFGHTHKALLKKVHRANGGIVNYMNSGSISINQVPILTYVVVDQTASLITTRARLIKYDPITGISSVLEETAVANSGSATPFAPKGWTCAPQYYNQTDGCDCDCGIPDPDCEKPESQLYGCVTAQNLNTKCVNGECQYTPVKPNTYTCPIFASGNVCQCGCGSYDPTCAFTNVTNCQDPTAIGCDENGDCVVTGSKKPPSTWTCPREWYGADDGCDCSCGTVDPDCASTSKCTCKGNVPVTFVPNFEVGFWVTLSLLIASLVLGSVLVISLVIGCVICVKRAQAGA